MSQPEQDPPTFDDALATVIQALNYSALIESVETTKSTETGNDTAILTVIGRPMNHPDFRFTLDLEVT